MAWHSFFSPAPFHQLLAPNLPPSSGFSKNKHLALILCLGFLTCAVSLCAFFLLLLTLLQTILLQNHQRTCSYFEWTSVLNGGVILCGFC